MFTPHKSNCLRAISKAIIVGCAPLLSSCPERPPEITVPNNRVQYFLAHEFSRMTSQQRYQDFMERELRAEFTEQEFVSYMEANDAECERDPQKKIMYCRYIDFKVVPRASDLLKTMNAVSYFCFWALPPADRPKVNFYQAGAGSISELPASRAEFARSRNIPICRSLLLKFRGIEK
jgi:hypothetical protein